MLQDNHGAILENLRSQSIAIRGGHRATGIMEIYDEEDTILHLPRKKNL